MGALCCRGPSPRKAGDPQSSRHLPVNASPLLDGATGTEGPKKPPMGPEGDPALPGPSPVSLSQLSARCAVPGPFPTAAGPSSAAAASRGNASVPPFHLQAGSRLKIHRFRGREGAREEKEHGAGGTELGAHSKPSRTWPGGVSSADGAGAGLQPPLGLPSLGREVTWAGQEQDHKCSAPGQPQPSRLQLPAAM